MAIDGYMYFKQYDNAYLPSESTVEVPKDSADQFFSDFEFVKALSSKGLFEIENFSFDIEQVLNIGSQSTGAGAGKVTFNPFSIDRKIDVSSPRLFEMACSGTPFMQV